MAPLQKSKSKTQEKGKGKSKASSSQPSSSSFPKPIHKGDKAATNVANIGSKPVKVVRIEDPTTTDRSRGDNQRNEADRSTNNNASGSKTGEAGGEEVESSATTTTTADEMFMRITTHGKMRNWVGVALKFLTEHEDNPACSTRSITLHTLPTWISPSILSPSSSSSSSGPSDPSQSVPSNPIRPPVAQSSKTPQVPTKPTAPTTTTTSASASTSAPTSNSASSLTPTPRLISTTEIIKREYIKHLEEKKSSRLKGLWQYNEIGVLEDLGVDMGGGGDGESGETDKERRAKEIVRALSGKHHTRQVQSPYMRITLSLVERPELMGSGKVSCQPPLIRKLSKSAKLRAKKRAKRERIGAGVDGDGPSSSTGVGNEDTGGDDAAGPGRTGGDDQEGMDVDVSV
ncbi:hypothetical protein CVT24_006829 [Panaeolus cyanescens]|uniref:Uncharacterized protein n=1 Tax=Panaeolus cyanescens TaxID=181874 RepID=A0A409YRZ3_9AGAR|nr:hypothetical protein CVT24_006829 [Panaeolus cyanescens]